MLLAEKKPATSARKPSSSPQTEERLWTKYRESHGQGNALSELMEHYLPLVTETVNRMSARFYYKVEPQDLLGVAILGLYEAIQRYSEQQGVPFAAFARKRISGAILDELRRRDPLSRRQRTLLTRVKSATEKLTAEKDRLPSEEELATFLGVPARQVAQAQGWEYGTVSLQEELGDGLTYQDIIPDEEMPTPRELADRASAKQALRRAIPKLDVRDQQLLFFRHSEALSITEIAAVFGVTPGRVSQMYNSTILRLRSLMNVEETQ